MERVPKRAWVLCRRPFYMRGAWGGDGVRRFFGAVGRWVLGVGRWLLGDRRLEAPAVLAKPSPYGRMRSEGWALTGVDGESFVRSPAGE